MDDKKTADAPNRDAMLRFDTALFLLYVLHAMPRAHGATRPPGDFYGDSQLFFFRTEAELVRLGHPNAETNPHSLLLLLLDTALFP